MCLQRSNKNKCDVLKFYLLLLDVFKNNRGSFYSFHLNLRKTLSFFRKVKQNRLKKDRLVADEMTGPNEGVEIHIWNPTVANLTLMVIHYKQSKNESVLHGFPRNPTMVLYHTVGKSTVRGNAETQWEFTF